MTIICSGNKTFLSDIPKPVRVVLKTLDEENRLKCHTYLDNEIKEDAIIIYFPPLCDAIKNNCNARKGFGLINQCNFNISIHPFLLECLFTDFILMIL